MADGLSRKRLKLWGGLLASGVLLAALGTSTFHWIYPEANLVRQARMAAARGDALMAGDLYAEARSRSRTPDLFLERERQARLAAGDLEGALGVLETMQERGYGSSLLQREKAGLLQALGRPQEAVAMWEDLLKSHPEDVEAHFGLAAATLQAGDLMQAEARFRDLLRIRPDHHAGRLEISKLLAWRGELSEAEVMLRELLASYPRWLEARVLLARVLSWKGEWEASAEQYRLALEGYS